MVQMDIQKLKYNQFSKFQFWHKQEVHQLSYSFENHLQKQYVEERPGAKFIGFIQLLDLFEFEKKKK